MCFVVVGRVGVGVGYWELVGYGGRFWFVYGVEDPSYYGVVVYVVGKRYLVGGCYRVGGAGSYWVDLVLVGWGYGGSGVVGGFDSCG